VVVLPSSAHAFLEDRNIRLDWFRSRVEVGTAD
jgi:hypothetical protein